MKRFAALFLILVVGLGLYSLHSWHTNASDHDDGETELKGRNLNLTDVYVFREDSQTGIRRDRQNVIFIVNSNPRSLAAQQYFFSTRARYEIHISRAQNRDALPTGADDIIFRFEFSAPDAAERQTMTVTAIKDGQTYSTTTTTGRRSIFTTSYNDAKISRAVVVNDFVLEGFPFTVFAGLREDPFFFDVDWFFRLRAFALGLGPQPQPLFRSAAEAIDFTTGYNVNSIVLRVPIAFLRANIIDVWATISIQQ